MEILYWPLVSCSWFFRVFNLSNPKTLKMATDISSDISTDRLKPKTENKHWNHWWKPKQKIQYEGGILDIFLWDSTNRFKIPRNEFYNKHHIIPLNSLSLPTVIRWNLETQKTSQKNNSTLVQKLCKKCWETLLSINCTKKLYNCQEHLLLIIFFIHIHLHPAGMEKRKKKTYKRISK